MKELPCAATPKNCVEVEIGGNPTIGVCVYDDNGNIIPSAVKRIDVGVYYVSFNLDKKEFQEVTPR